MFRCFSYLAVVVCGLLISATVLSDCELLMGYKTGGKSAFIADMPDNEGLYEDLYKEAASRIGCSLKIVRMPKNRIHRDLQFGLIDFYPGAAFSGKRAEYLYFAANGLATQEYGVSSPDVPVIKDLSDLRYHSVYWVMGSGSSKEDIANKLGIRTVIRSDMNIDVLQRFFQKRPGIMYFYLADREQVLTFNKERGYEVISEGGLKLHPDCCGPPSPMFLGFARKSKHYQEEPNADFLPSVKISPVNFPTRVVEGSVASRLFNALKQMEQEGLTGQLYDQWFK